MYRKKNLKTKIGKNFDLVYLRITPIVCYKILKIVGLFNVVLTKDISIFINCFYIPIIL